VPTRAGFAGDGLNDLRRSEGERGASRRSASRPGSARGRPRRSSSGRTREPADDEHRRVLHHDVETSVSRVARHARVVVSREEPEVAAHCANAKPSRRPSPSWYVTRSRPSPVQARDTPEPTLNAKSDVSRPVSSVRPKRQQPRRSAGTSSCRARPSPRPDVELLAVRRSRSSRSHANVVEPVCRGRSRSACTSRSSFPPRRGGRPCTSTSRHRLFDRIENVPLGRAGERAMLTKRSVSGRSDKDLVSPRLISSSPASTRPRPTGIGGGPNLANERSPWPHPHRERSTIGGDVVLSSPSAQLTVSATTQPPAQQQPPRVRANETRGII